MFFRNVQIKEHGKVGELPCSGPPTSGDDAFDGAAFDGCKWDRTVRFDPATLHQSGGSLHVETSGGDIYGANDTGPTNFVLQDAPAGDWTAETTVKVPLVQCCQQAGLIVHDSDDDYVKFDVIADGDRARFELRSETGDVVAQPETSEWLPYPEDDTYQLRLTKTGDTYSAAFRVTGGEWNTFDTPVTNTAVAGAPVGLFALGIFQDAPIYASFESFDITGDAPAGRADRAGLRRPAERRRRRSRSSSRPPATTLTAARSPTAWDFGDGQSTIGQQPVHTYRTPGEYEATVTAIDDEGDDDDRHRAGDRRPAGQPAAARAGGRPADLRRSAAHGRARGARQRPRGRGADLRVGLR